MRKKPLRHDISFYRFTAELQTRYADVDTERHINNVAVLCLHAEVRSLLYLLLFGRETWLAQTDVVRLAGLETAFLRIAHYPAPVTGGVSLVDISDRDFTLAVGLFQEGICVGLQECRMGAWRGGEWIALPPAVRSRLIEFGIVTEPT